MNSPTLPHTSWWHGSQKWDGHPEIKPSRKGCYECGPGLYLTNRRQTALKYSKGAGSLVHVGLDPNITLLQDVCFTRAQMQDALDSIPRLRRRAAIEADLDRSARRHPDDQLPAIYLVNLCVNHEALSGDAGPALARWLTAHGVDASLEGKSGKEEWLIVFNPKALVYSQKLTAKEADALPYDFDTFDEQRARLQPAANPLRLRR